MPTSSPATALSLSAQFKKDHAAYFFDDAHHQVEAAATREAKEVSPNVFEFSDGSVLQIVHRPPVVTAYADRACFLSAVPPRTAAPVAESRI
jgi:hypothetical protein